MNLGLSTAGVTVRAAGALSPELGAAVALPLFARVATPRPVGAGAQDTMWAARRSTLRIPGLARSGADVILYEWGTSGDVVVLAHGWDGRASQFAALVRELLAEGYRVVAFDAPAHGDSLGRGTYLIDWIDALGAIRRRYGRLHTVVGHSFGGLATLIAAADGLAVDRVVTVAAPADADLLLTQFQAMLRFDDRTAAALRVRFADRFFPGERDPFARLSAVRRPLPHATPLLAAHDEGDRVVPFGELARIVEANAGTQIAATRGFGHNRILESDAFLDAVLAFTGQPVSASESSAAGDGAEREDVAA
ncbi:alpha/beta fold hydrolase [Microbacterium flavescens]|uniref:alpha/beta fold hydrolase n=1 Tax=Microbacterium flavescens TaxID=69366 RepID=UPI001BDDEE2F|nr:alpha/beta fold hydrolase [Microbacterium flavescens]